MSCNQVEKPLTGQVEQAKVKAEEVKHSKADSIIQNAILAHGGKLYEQAHYEFIFRENWYRFRNNYSNYEYEYKGINKVGDSIRTKLTQDKVQVWKNGAEQEFNEKQKLSYSDNLNSVIYFATLPHKLKDKSVNKKYMGETKVFEKSYEIIKITFSQEGGGTDYEDEYYYWFNAETNLIDYLAYNYQVNGGGVRFRKAYNTREVGGIVFHDYVNYKAPVGTDLDKLPALLETNKLTELSRIETKNVALLDN